MRARYGLTPRRACELDGSRHTSGAKAIAQHAPPSRRRSRGGARMKAGDACDSLQAPRRLRWQRSIAAGGAMVPVVSTGTREETARARTVAPLPLL